MFCIKPLKPTLLILFISIVNSVFSQEITCNNPVYKFGFVTEGDTVSVSYELKNSGDKPLVISSYEVECGCTTMEKVYSAIEPGETYTIKVKFDTHEKYDRQDRTITLISNAKNSPTVLRFKGVVLKKKK
ncbi:MAG: hypothetical protein A3F72_00320 [Bacteroidetes bacterium RIFCSPLOWO2_12_FULL_35_15]|nr:MAG: hypothetical protein A3F72_00320 [Bacteroidetes bacterium RIFCSPLOWO2_12_FULL_35_15]